MIDDFESDVTDLDRAKAVVLVLSEAELCLKVSLSAEDSFGTRVRRVLQNAMTTSIDPRHYAVLWMFREMA